MAHKQTGYTKISGAAASTGLGSIPSGSTYAIVQAETQNIRLRFDGTAPTATDGFLLVAGNALEITSPLSKVRLIEVAATATVHVLFYKN